jgi:phosphoribosyl 1,2-cyclic phosphodiesterase
MRLSVLASGSSGNSFYIENEDKGILIDAGLSCRKIVERLSSLNVSPEKIQGVFLTHEHADHIKGVDVLARKFQLPIFATRGTCEHFLCSQEDLINTIKSDETIKLGNMEVRAFSKSHLGKEPVSFNISNGKTISIITDLGFVCKNTQDAINNSDFLCIESNHDIKMLENGPYPYYLKKWVKSDIGHLSNLQASLGVLEFAKPKLKNILLSHISKNNNTNLLALSSFSILKERSDLHPRILAPEHGEMTDFFKI